MAKTCRKACAKTAAIISLVLVFAFMFIVAGFNNDWGGLFAYKADNQKKNDGRCIYHAYMLAETK